MAESSVPDGEEEAEQAAPDEGEEAEWAEGQAEPGEATEAETFEHGEAGSILSAMGVW